MLKKSLRMKILKRKKMNRRKNQKLKILKMAKKVQKMAKLSPKTVKSSILLSPRKVKKKRMKNQLINRVVV